MASVFCIVPPYILQAIAENGDEHQRAAALKTLGTDKQQRAKRSLLTTKPTSKTPSNPGGQPQRSIADCRHASETTGAKVVRKEDGAATGDPETDEAYDALGATYNLFWNVFKRNSIDARGMALDAFVHYGQRYDNAFWDGTEMIFGDGDGTTFNRFTISVDVIGHELTHGVTQHTANLDYSGQPGALNESISDVFGSLVKQYLLQQTVTQADWLIGAGLMKGKQDTALRSMKAPGTAYNDPVLGSDPQPGDMSGYVETNDDNGGVHLNSGIPNRAFYLAASQIGGNAWNQAGKIWYDTLTNTGLVSDADFKTFAKATIATATSTYGSSSTEATAVANAWKTVGVLTAAIRS